MLVLINTISGIIITDCHSLILARKLAIHPCYIHKFVNIKSMCIINKLCLLIFKLHIYSVLMRWRGSHGFCYPSTEKLVIWCFPVIQGDQPNQKVHLLESYNHVFIDLCLRNVDCVLIHLIRIQLLHNHTMKVVICRLEC